MKSHELRIGNWITDVRGEPTELTEGLFVELIEMDWIDVKTKHFADIEKTEGGGYTWESDLIDEPFMVAIPLDKGWCIQQVILVDEVGLRCYIDENSDSDDYFGWEITDVTHWFKPVEPTT